MLSQSRPTKLPVQTDKVAGMGAGMGPVMVVAGRPGRAGANFVGLDMFRLFGPTKLPGAGRWADATAGG